MNKKYIEMMCKNVIWKLGLECLMYVRKKI